MQLFIAEKPSLARAIAEFLPGPKRSGEGFIQCGNDIKVTWCIGHILELAPPEDYLPDSLRNEKGKISWDKMPLPVLPKEWRHQPKKDTMSQLRVIQRLLKEATSVVNAGDPDREGQLLVDEVLEYSNNRKPVQRIWLAALDETSVKRALASLKDNKGYNNLKKAAESRQKADWLVGMNLTVAYSVAGGKNGYRGVLSVGRVQTPTLALIVKRDLEIENFKPKDYFVLRGQFAHPNGAFWATWKPKEGAASVDEEGRILDRRIVDAVAAKVHKKPAAVVHSETKDGKQPPPLTFSLSSLQVAASSKFGLSAQQVLDICQALYEKHKLTSYPRTDCEFLPESQLSDAKAIMGAIANNNPNLTGILKQANPVLKSRAWNDSKITAHHAIIPTATKANPSSLNDMEAKVYEMICKQYLAQFYPDRTYKDVKVEVECEGERFAAGGQTTINPGWKVVFGAEADEPEDGKKNEEPAQKLPAMKQGDSAPNAQVAVDAKKTQPPKPFTDGTLVKAMTNIHQYVQKPEIKRILKETAGIGTEATRAAIIETLIKRGFIVKKGKNLISTPTGRAFIRDLPAEMTDPGLTGLFEQSLSGIEEGKIDTAKFGAMLEEFVAKLCKHAQGANVNVPSPEGGGYSSSAKRGSGGFARKSSSSYGKSKTGSYSKGNYAKGGDFSKSSKGAKRT